MRIFVAGASGVIGRPLLPRLLADGHEVTAMTRTPAKADALRERGVEPVVCDALDPTGLKRAMAAASPQVVIDHLTDLPKAINPRRAGRDFAATDRLRAEGTANLVAAAREAGARRVVAQSVCFLYAPGGSDLRREQDPLYLDAPPPFDRSVAALAALEREVTRSEGIDGVVLRFGFWYGPGTAYGPDGSIAEMVRKRRYPVVGDGSGVFSLVHLDDVVEATVAGLESPPGIYNVTDDEPAPARDWLPAYADALGAPPPRRAPKWLARILGGAYSVYAMTQLPGASNEKARHELDWTPRHPSWRQGFRDALG
jgi:nucleoside-diphosphate-sugar epimerase